MSDTTERRADIAVFDALPRPARAEYQPGDVWAMAAEREARAILAVTEPESIHTSYDGTAPRWEPSCRIEWDLALAESLAAFVDGAE